MIIYCSECGKVLGVIEKGGFKEIPAQIFVMCGDCVEPSIDFGGFGGVEESDVDYLRYREAGKRGNGEKGFGGGWYF